MKKVIAIIAGEPNSISSEIIFKTWYLRKKFNHLPFFIVGSFSLLNLQAKKLKYGIKIKKINEKFSFKDLRDNQLPVLNINYEQKKPFQKISTKSSKYILNCFKETIKLIKKNKIYGFVNCPVSKEFLFKNKYKGITEFLSELTKKQGKETMLIYNKKLSVCPITTHIPLKNVSKNLSKYKIINKVKIINNFYKRIFNKKPKLAILGLNPHNFSPLKKSEEDTIIVPAIKSLKKMGLNVTGPISTDTSFLQHKKFNVVVGMYHDQVLTPYKSLFEYEAINITLGLPFIRISPDHGVAENILGKKIANPQSLIQSILFFNNLK